MDTSTEPNGRGIGKLSGLLFLFLMLLSVGGVAVMDFSESAGIWYWLATTLAFAVTSILIAWQQSLVSEEERSPHVRRQLLHWIVVTIGILLVFLLERTEHLPPTTGGLCALLVLSIGTILAGIHFEWRLSILGLLLAITFIAAVFAEEFFWVMLIPVIIAGAVLVVRRKQE